MKKSTELMYEADHHYTYEETMEEAMNAMEVLNEISSLPNAPRPIEAKYEDIPPLEVEVDEFSRVYPTKKDGTRTPGKVSVKKHTRTFV